MCIFPLGLVQLGRQGSAWVEGKVYVGLSLAYSGWLTLRFVATDGSLESGIDGGGLFKEFMQLGR